MMFLLAVTLTSMLLAAIMSIVAWRIAREERRRSEARIAALAADIHGHRRPIIERVAPAPPAFDDLELRPSGRAAAVGRELFTDAQPRAESQWPPVVVGGAFVALIAVALIVVSSSASNVGARGAAPAPAAALRPQPSPVHPLELLALAHERNGDQLTVRGVVRNPESGPAVEHLTAVVVLLNGDGSVLTSGRAAIGPAALRPGGEAPFTVTLPDKGEVGRYRVSFRTDDRVVPHVDRRDAAQARL